MKKFLLFILFCGILFIGCEKTVNDKNLQEKVQDNIDEIVDKTIDDFNYGNISPAEALKIFTNIIEQKNGDVHVNLYVERGKIKKELKDYEGALEDINKGLEVNPEAWMYVERGGVKILLNDLEGALEDMNKGLELKQKGWMYLMRGKIKIELKDYEGALEDFNKALALGPKGWMHEKEGDRANIQVNDLKDIAYIYINRGICKRNLGDVNGALEDMDRALGIDTESWMFVEKDGKKITLKDLEDNNIKELIRSERINKQRIEKLQIFLEEYDV